MGRDHDPDVCAMLRDRLVSRRSIIGAIGIDTLTQYSRSRSRSDWRRQWQAIDFAESGYGQANDIDK
jgi:hypothetical protein